MNDTHVIIVVIISIALFFVVREIINWYLKINKRVQLQKLTLETLLKIYEKNGGDVDWEEINVVLDKSEPINKRHRVKQN